MYEGEDLYIKYFEKYNVVEEKGLKSFVKTIKFQDESFKDDIVSQIEDSTELIWYPGCGGDVSPCTILERKKFEQKNGIATSNKRIYLFVDSDSANLCESAFGSNRNIYDCSVEDYKEKYNIKHSTKIYIEGNEGEELFSGYYVWLSLGNEVCNILYLNMRMEDFLITVIKPYNLSIKWLFFFNMESGSGYLFKLFCKLGISFPQWICANRAKKLGLWYYAENLASMEQKDGNLDYLEAESSDRDSRNFQYGPMNSIIAGSPLIKLLKDVNVLCRDDGVCFDKKEHRRVDVIREKLSGTDYSIIEDDIFLLCHKKPLSEYADDTILISSHIDCKQQDDKEAGISRCYSTVVSDNLLRGTYDNSITNAAVLALMIQNKLPDNVIVAFTGDEEEDSNGAIQVAEFLHLNNILFKCIVLDVTEVGWKEEALFTVENNFWKDQMGKKVIQIVDNFQTEWRFVPENHDCVPGYVNPDYIYKEEAEEDESWEYDECHIECFSLCIPVNGDMHSDEGVFARINSFEKYIEVLQCLANERY